MEKYRTIQLNNCNEFIYRKGKQPLKAIKNSVLINLKDNEEIIITEEALNKLDFIILTLLYYKNKKTIKVIENSNGLYPFTFEEILKLNKYNIGYEYEKKYQNR